MSVPGALGSIVFSRRTDAVALGGLDAGGVEDLGPEVSELGGLLEVQATYWARSVDVAWVIVVHAVDIRPDLDLVGAQHRAHERRGVVAPPALQVVDVAEGIAADVALGDEEACPLGGAADELLEVRAYVVLVGLGLLVGAHVF